jgi:hypothetical protein
MFGARYLLACTTIVVTGCSTTIPGAVELFRDGKSRHQIVLNAQASPSEKFAAQELQTHFRACTGIELPIVEGAPEANAPMIVLGCGAVARGLGVDPKPEKLGEQGFVLKTVPPHVVIAGTRQAGTLHGVHRFLEQYLGVRWYAPGVTETPHIAGVSVPATDRLIKPAFLMRNTSYAWPGGDAIFRARQGDNRNGHTADDPQGIGYAFDGTCHSYFSYISPREFFKVHPEYFSEIGGVRVGEETQLCLTNPDVLRIVTERMLKRMEGQPNVRQHNFSQMDYYNYCQCAKCKAINHQYGTLGGTQYWFVNQLAERTSKVFPKKLIGTLAYMYTEEPPKNLKMHPNVAVWLCHMFPCCDSHPIATCPLNADYKRRAGAWSKVCSHLYIWHYIVDFAHYYNPFPNFRAMAADMKFYRAIGVEGIYLQGMGHHGGGGEFSLLRPYYGMKLLWDPGQDAESIIREFLEGYYGPAAEPIRQYIAMLHDKVEKENIHMHLYTNPAQGYLTDEVVRRGMALFDQAETAVKDNPELLERVRVARMPLTYARLFPRNGYKIEGGRLHWLGDIATQVEAVKFVQMMKKHGFQTVREWGGEPEQMIMLGGVLNSRLEVVTIRNEHLSVDVVPILAGRALRIIDRKTGKCVTAHNVKRCLFFPFCGGLEDRSGETFRFYGWIEPATVVARSDSSVAVTIQTMDGNQLKRTLTLSPDKPILEVVSTLTNPKEKAREVRLRSHLELDLGDLRTTCVRFTDRSGKQVDKDMTQIIAGMRQGEHFYDQNAPAGAWTLTGSKGLQLKQTFDTDLLDFTWLYAYPEDLGEIEVEVWLKRKVLEPGQTVTLRQQIEVRPMP